MKKVLILTDERCGGVSFQNIVSSFYSKNMNAIDDLRSQYKVFYKKNNIIF